jgi:hypothetical protein
MFCHRGLPWKGLAALSPRVADEEKIVIFGVSSALQTPLGSGVF